MQIKSYSFNKKLFALFALFVATTAGFHFWKQGQQVGQRCYHPSHEYYYEKYKTLNLFPFMTNTGGGGDNTVGYTRLYNKDGNLLKERFGHIEDEQEVLHWDSDAAYFLGGRGETWKLPTTMDSQSFYSAVRNNPNIYCY